MARFRHTGMEGIGTRRLAVVFLVPWITCWLTIFPLIHVHPEADHAHGETTHHHGGLVHSVLSQDLPCEFGTSTHQPATVEQYFSVLPFPNAFPHHMGSHLEITLSAMYQAPDKPLKKHAATFSVSLQTISAPFSCKFSETATSRERHWSIHDFIHSYISRPPPTLSM